jgi:hypothetical protein
MLAIAIPSVLGLLALGFSLVYLMAGGGLMGAVVIFFVAKMLHH